MGGRGSGGSRAGAGRKLKSNAERAALGDATHRGRVLAHPSSAHLPAPIEEFDAPNDLVTDERLVWLELAPFAFQNRTLTRATALMFKRMCRNIVLERDLAAGADRGGANHRGVMQRIDAELLRFNLSPNGKALYDAVPVSQPVNKLSRFTSRG